MAGFYIPFLGEFPIEQGIIGKLILAYSALEVDLSYIIEAAFSSATATKLIFGTRGETQRIEITDCICREPYRNLELESAFTEAIAAMRFALKVRNQYTHCNWFSESGRLAFINLEDAAKSNNVASIGILKVCPVDAPLLIAQERYFGYVQNCLEYLKMEYLTRVGKSSNQSFPKPRKVPQPLLHNRKKKHLTSA